MYLPKCIKTVITPLKLVINNYFFMKLAPLDSADRALNLAKNPSIFMKINIPSGPFSHSRSHWGQATKFNRPMCILATDQQFVEILLWICIECAKC